MKLRKPGFWLVALFGLTLTIAGCQGEQPASPANPTAEIFLPAVNASNAAEAQASPTTTGVPASVEASAAAPVATPRPDLQASDPATVNLASGRLQLVEFFAFW